jgi:methylated-DNA-protein-cysteine methyltransferase related protein
MPGAASGWERIYAVVRRIPRGRVATYGQVAALGGMRGRAREVGWALSALRTESAVPWQRVINARGEVSGRGEPEASRVQRALLEREGIAFSRSGRVDLAAYLWRPRGAKPGPDRRAASPRKRKARPRGRRARPRGGRPE